MSKLTIHAGDFLAGKESSVFGSTFTIRKAGMLDIAQASPKAVIDRRRSKFTRRRNPSLNSISNHQERCSGRAYLQKLVLTKSSRAASISANLKR